MIRVAILIDGGHLRVLAKLAKLGYTPHFVEKVAQACKLDDETIFRVLYYDCAPYNGKTKLPVSGEVKEFDGDDSWLRSLACKNLIAVRRGVLKFRGWKPKNVPVSPKGLSDDDFYPDFEQKGVDMRIGLDIATFCRSKSVERIILITNDTDCIPAMKYGRIAGLQICVIRLPGRKVAQELLWHADFERKVGWPA